MTKTRNNLSSYCPTYKYQYAGTCYAYAVAYSGLSTEFNIMHNITNRSEVENTTYSAGVVASYHNSSLWFYKRSKMCDQLGTAQKALKILKKVGTVFSSDFDCGCLRFSDIKKQVSPKVHWQRITDYKRLKVHNKYSDSNVDWIKSALSKDHPVIIGMWQNDFVRNLTVGSIDYDLPDQVTLDYVSQFKRGISNHAACIVGYDDAYNGGDKGYFLLKNNFENWGNGTGFCWIPYSYLTPMIYEAYYIKGFR
ncbi:MAG: hypothetical protein CMO01_23195 [Thalassobius sp.]|nr:hypothetical protein [Thalassovita sp.]